MDDLIGQMSLFDFMPKRNSLVREKCLYGADIPCNILNVHDVARMDGIDCQYGCCKTCKHNAICGACCWQSANIIADNQKEERCYSCKHLNRDKKKVTGERKQIYYFGCNISETGYIPGGCAKGDEDKWLKRQWCGGYECKEVENYDTDT